MGSGSLRNLRYSVVDEDESWTPAFSRPIRSLGESRDESWIVVVEGVLGVGGRE